MTRFDPIHIKVKIYETKYGFNTNPLLIPVQQHDIEDEIRGFQREFSALINAQRDYEKRFIK